jgi:hypothetical protein
VLGVQFPALACLLGSEARTAWPGLSSSDPNILR